MAKLKLGAIPDDKPVKLSVELPAAVHRDLLAYAEAIGGETGQVILENRRPYAGAIYGDGPRIPKGTTQRSDRGRRIALAQEL
jgi:Protein of unknown function (DUF2274)